MFRTNRQDSGRRRIRSATRTTSALSAFAMCAGALVATTATSLIVDDVASAAGPCVVSQTLKGGVKDGYVTTNGTEAPSPSAAHKKYWENNHPAGSGLPLKNYDDPVADQWFAETFSGITVPAGRQICAATLGFAATWVGNPDTNDTIGVHFVVDQAGTPTQSSAAETWSRDIGNYEEMSGTGKFLGLLNLANLPVAGPLDPGISMLKPMQDRGFIDVWIQDGTQVDFLELTISTMPSATPAGGSAVSMLATPGRLMDSRPNGDTPDDVAEKDGPLGSQANNPFGNGVYRLKVAGRLGVEASARAAVLNVTAVNPQGAGYLTIFPCNGATPTPPLAASLNFGAGIAAVGNNVTVGLDESGNVCVYSSVISDIVVDIAGFFAQTSAFQTILPERIVDTRLTAVASQVVTGGVVGGGNAQALTKLEIDVAGIGSIPSDAIAVAMNIAAVNPQGQGFVTAYPCDVGRPLTASLNFSPSVNVSNGVMIGVAQTTDATTDGKVCVYTSVETNLVMDIGGYYPAGGGFVPSAPVRYLDTRTTPGSDTVDGINQGIGVVPGGTDLTVQMTGRPGVPAGASAVAVNFAAIRPAAEAATGFTSAGYVTAYPGPCGTAPLTSNLNVSIGDAVKANGAVIALPATGEICVYASRNVDLIMDVTGYFPA